VSYAQALERSAEVKGKRHLLLGNGFSIACRPESFSYGQLLAEADLGSLSVPGNELFEYEETVDFERVIRSLRVAARMADFYETTDPSLSARFGAGADHLKDILAATLAKKHPDNVGEISEAEYRSAHDFLVCFDHFFTLNYDRLLYWALLQEFEPAINHNDGFSSDADDEDAPWVVWNDYRQDGQTVYFVHGGLHLYAQGATLRKLTFSRTGIALVDQIRDQLDDGALPLIVTEGSSEEKHAAILHHAYLAKSLRSLTSRSGSLFVHGHSLDDTPGTFSARSSKASTRRCS